MVQFENNMGFIDFQPQIQGLDVDLGKKQLITNYINTKLCH